ncbi:putative efflux protein, MATE family [Clostridium cavendishii DSM 21758]|uniref:Multidrug export protein MepA n=1 Tax=Clostridium cavendishii DSM 21758 TaxID=1121302 RepID=A0A1M6PFQ5_9CLOT|nr:MATE family efflux transporter [Clostridium cavendishii]SHK06732.1 putative efflux protein, MATE family [Clostridium cavendishii DSM 21758]
MDKQKRLGEEKVSSLLVTFSVPAIIGMLVNAFYNIVDRMFIGHIPEIGKLAITGVGITMPIMTIMMGFGMLVGIGTAAVISIKLGQGKKDEAEEILGNAFTLLIIFSVIITILGLLFVDNILVAFGASSDTIVYAKEFITIIFIGTIVNMVSFGLNHSIRSEGNPGVAMATMLIGAILNVILEPIFIFVLGLGVRGGAIATVISQMVATVWILRYFTKGDSFLKLKVSNMKLKKEYVKSIFAIGISPFAIQVAASAVQVVSNNSLRIYGGDLAIGAMTVISSVAMIFLMPIFGLNQGSQPIIGYNYGAMKYDRVKDTVKYGVIAATTVVVIGFIVIHLFPQAIIKMFNSDEQLIEIGVKGLKIFLFMMPVIGFQIISANFFQSIGKAKISIFLSLLRQVIILIPMLIILPKFLGLTGVWLSGPIADFTSSVITGVFLFREFNKLTNLQNQKESKSELAI